MSYEELVKDAANKYGFNLEFKTKNIFEKQGFTTQHNTLMKLNGELLEIDILAKKHTNMDFIIECKGTDSSSVLILVQESEEQDNFKIMRRHIIEGTNYRLVGYDAPAFCTFTGDFFNNNNKELKKASRNDDDNNFYKAQLQIIDAISAFIKNESLKESYIIPMIITNANIWVVNYNTTEKKITSQYKWIFHKVKIGKNFKLEQREDDAEILSFIIPVVNILYLEDFIKLSQSMNISTHRIKANLLEL